MTTVLNSGTLACCPLADPARDGGGKTENFFFCKNETNSNFINEIFYGKNNNNIARKPYRLAARTPLGAYSAPLWATLAPQEPIPQFSVLSGLELSPLSGIGPQSTWPIM